MKDFITQNIYLVYYILHHDYSRFVFDEDIIQAGMLGLCQWAKNYKPEKGKFSYYVQMYIHDAVRKEIKAKLNYRNDVEDDMYFMK